MRKQYSPLGEPIDGKILKIHQKEILFQIFQALSIVMNGQNLRLLSAYFLIMAAFIWQLVPIDLLLHRLRVYFYRLVLVFVPILSHAH